MPYSVCMDITLIRSLREAIKDAGGVSAVARRLGLKPPTVYQWISEDAKQNRPVPIEKCADLEQVLAGRVTRQQLRPKDWRSIWPELSSRRTRNRPIERIGSIDDTQPPTGRDTE